LPLAEHIAELVAFGQRWAGLGSIVVHCRAGTSRSPAAAMILAAVLPGPKSDDLVRRVATAKTYYRPHRGMLALADRILKRRTPLIELLRSISTPAVMDTWGPASIPLADR
jgi:predicted protein tyrosine phosphatase